MSKCLGKVSGLQLLDGPLHSEGLILIQQLLPDWLLFLHQCLLADSCHLRIPRLVIFRGKCCREDSPDTLEQASPKALIPAPSLGVFVQGGVTAVVLIFFVSLCLCVLFSHTHTLQKLHSPPTAYSQLQRQGETLVEAHLAN